MENTLTGSQAHRTDVVSEGDWGTELKQSDIVVELCDAVIAGMSDDAAHSPALTIGVAAIQVLTTQENSQATGVRAETMTTETVLCKEITLCQGRNHSSQSQNHNNR